jgi:hypothetical protein
MRTLTADEVAAHGQRTAQGWSVVEDAIEPDLLT